MPRWRGARTSSDGPLRLMRSEQQFTSAIHAAIAVLVVNSPGYLARYFIVALGGYTMGG